MPIVHHIHWKYITNTELSCNSLKIKYCMTRGNHNCDQTSHNNRPAPFVFSVTYRY